MSYGYGGDGGPMPPEPPRRGRRRALVLGGALVGVLALSGAGWWAWAAFTQQGDQPAEALPASTVGYVAVDLDPSGAQKLEAIRTLRKFPAFTEATGLDVDDDVRERIFDEISAEADCDVDYAADVEPWLGNRFAVAAVPADDAGGGDDPVVPVGVLQITDAGAAEDGLTTLADCGDGGEGGFAVGDGWAVVAETDEIAAAVLDAGADDPLSDDGDYQEWTDAAGDAGIVSAYAAPGAGDLIAEAMTSELGGGDVCVDDPFCDDFSPLGPDAAIIEQALGDFDGAALTVRFDGGALEVESAFSGGAGLAGALTGGSLLGSGGDAYTTVGSLPADTVLAYGLGHEPGWVEQLVGQFGAMSGLGEDDLDQAFAEAEAELGISVPEDLETLLGESVAVSLGDVSDLDLDALATDPTGLPLTVKVQGDAEEIDGVLDTLLANPALGPDAALVQRASDDDTVVVGFDEARAESMLDDGGLGDSDVFRSAVPDAEGATGIFFADLGAVDPLLDQLADAGEPELADNLRPLEAIGMSSSDDDGVTHGLLRVTTD
ncbi:MAG: hypothetical protein CMH83_08300 [Nocardioides sp.]|nr:hypothetical protein [Nocardioides sp.]